jgi:Predicted Zn-dependent hydrolases of the beta-lactamase fold
MKSRFFLFLTFLFSMDLTSAATFDVDTFKTQNGQEVKVTFIGHGSLMLTYKNQTIQVDPVSGYADYSGFPKADVILVTHEHEDHFDAKSIEKLTKKGTLLVVNEAVEAKLGKGKVLKNGDKLRLLDKVSVEAIPAYNTTAGREKFHPRYRDNGYLLVVEGLKIYISGDTEDIPELKDLKKVDIAFLSVNQPYTMTVAQAAHAAKIIGPKIFYPYHFGDTDVRLLKEELKGSGIELRIRKMK